MKRAQRVSLVSNVVCQKSTKILLGQRHARYSDKRRQSPEQAYGWEEPGIFPETLSCKERVMWQRCWTWAGTVGVWQFISSEKSSAPWLRHTITVLADPLKYSFSVIDTDCAMQAPASPFLGLENSCVRASDPREALCSCHGCGLCRGLLCWSWCGGEGSWVWHRLYLQEEEFSCSDALSCRPTLQLFSTHPEDPWSNGSVLIFLSLLLMLSFFLTHTVFLSLFFSSLPLISPGEISVLVQGSGCVPVCLQGQYIPELLQIQTGKLWTRKESSKAPGWLEYFSWS